MIQSYHKPRFSPTNNRTAHALPIASRLLSRYLLAIGTLFTGCLIHLMFAGCDPNGAADATQRRRLCNRCVNTKVEKIGRQFFYKKLRPSSCPECKRSEPPSPG